MEEGLQDVEEEDLRAAIPAAGCFGWPSRSWDTTIETSKFIMIVDEFCCTYAFATSLCQNRRPASDSEVLRRGFLMLLINVRHSSVVAWCQ